MTSVERRADLPGDAGADYALVLRLDQDTADDLAHLVKDVVLGTLHAAAVVAGANLTYGDGAGDVALLERLGGDRGEREGGAGFEVIVVPLDGTPEAWSSSYAAAASMTVIECAAAALGRPAGVRGPVQRGDQRGRQLGYRG